MQGAWANRSTGLPGPRRWAASQQGWAWAAAILVGIGVGLSVILSTYYVEKPILVAGVIGLPIYIIVSLRWPELAILALVGITAGVINKDWMPLLRLGPVSLHIPDIMLGVLLGIVFVRSMASPGARIVRSPLSLPLILFMGALLIAVANSLLVYHIDANQVLRGIRPLLQWLIFIPVVQLVRGEQALRRLIAGLWMLTVLLSMAVIVRDMIPDLHPAILPVTTVTLSTADAYFAGVTRVYMAGDRLLYVMVPVTVASLAVHRGGHVRSALLLIMLGMLSFWLVRSFQRNYWLTITLSCALLPAFVIGAERIRLIGRLLPFVLGFVLLVMAQQVIDPGGAAQMQAAVLDRAESLLEDLTRTDSSVQWRLIESQYALQQIARHPLLGIGVANPYRPPLEFEAGMFILDFYAHNAYLWIAVMAGLAGLLPFVWLCMSFIIRALRMGPRIKDAGLRAVCVGFGVAFVGVMVSNLVAPNLVQNWSLSIYPLMMGINEIVYRAEAVKGHTS